jgi:hypothetical protein
LIAGVDPFAPCMAKYPRAWRDVDHDSTQTGPRNAELDDQDCGRITAAFAQAGIPASDVVQTIEALAYVRFSRRDRKSRQQERERHDQLEAWGEP